DEHEDWGEFTEEELEADPSVPDLRAHFREVNQVNETFDEDEEWEGLTEGALNPEPEVFREEPNAAPAIPNLSAMPGDNDAEWEEFEALDPFTSPIDSESSLDNIELEEDWDDFSAEELEPYPKISDSASDRELGGLEDTSASSAMSSRVFNDEIATSPPSREDNPETFDLEGLEFEEVDLGERASEETFPSDEELFGEIAAARPQVPPNSPENSSGNPSRSQ
ncbi:MAG: hypothetical protein SVX43_02865, partial [Cyanobacteriota bacterium]|nr:hypothetical protein [Cyanobacteriota bacterium]